MHRRALLAALAALPLLPAAARAHHGWAWTTGGNIRLTGIIREARLGNPHGVLTVDANGEMWTVEVGQPWRNARAGLADGALAPGVEVAIEGEPAADVPRSTPATCSESPSSSGRSCRSTCG